MRVSIASFCMVLVLHSPTGAAEPLAPAPTVRTERADSAGLERAWPPRSSGLQLVQRDGDAEAALGDANDDDRIAQLEARRRSIRRGWPIAGVVTGSLMSVGGIVTLVAVKWSCRDDPWFSDEPPRTRCEGGSIDGKWAAGGLTLASGLILTGVSSWILAKRNREQRAIRREIRELERARMARTASAWSLAVDSSEPKTLRVTWRF